MMPPCACADCGCVLEWMYLFCVDGRVLCVMCWQLAIDHEKQIAETWLLEQWFQLGAA